MKRRSRVEAELITAAQWLVNWLWQFRAALLQLAMHCSRIECRKVQSERCRVEVQMGWRADGGRAVGKLARLGDTTEDAVSSANHISHTRPRWCTLPSRWSHLARCPKYFGQPSALLIREVGVGVTVRVKRWQRSRHILQKWRLVNKCRRMKNCVNTSKERGCAPTQAVAYICSIVTFFGNFHCIVCTIVAFVCLHWFVMIM